MDNSDICNKKGSEELAMTKTWNLRLLFVCTLKGHRPPFRSVLSLSFQFSFDTRREGSLPLLYYPFLTMYHTITIRWGPDPPRPLYRVEKHYYIKNYKIRSMKMQNDILGKGRTGRFDRAIRTEAESEKCLTCKDRYRQEVKEFDPFSYGCPPCPFRMGRGMQDHRDRAPAIRSQCEWCLDFHHTSHCPPRSCFLFNFR